MNLEIIRIIKNETDMIKKKLMRGEIEINKSKKLNTIKNKDKVEDFIINKRINFLNKLINEKIKIKNKLNFDIKLIENTNFTLKYSHIHFFIDKSALYKIQKDPLLLKLKKQQLNDLNKISYIENSINHLISLKNELKIVRKV